MKKIFLFLCGIALVATGCEEESSSNVSQLTNFPTFVLNGDAVMFVPKGTVFEDPGVTVTEGDVEIPYETSVSGQFQGGTTVDTNVDDIYTITYSAVNQDGYPGQAIRKVIVYDNGDLTSSIAGVYRSTVVRNGAASAQYTDMEYVMIWNTGGNNYHVSDGIGGYYAIGRAYGDAYLAPMDVVANDIPSNNFTVPDFTVGTFGGVAHNTEFTVNPGAGTIHFVTDWSEGYTFDVTLEQVQP